MTPAAPGAPRISVVVVSYQVRELLRTCLQTIRAQRGVSTEVWVVDNASQDGSADMVAAEFPDIHLVRNRENVGFARANNQALARARGEFLALVNPDTELPPDTLASVVGVFRRHAKAGVVGVALRNADGSVQPSCHAFPTVANLLLEATPFRNVGRAMGWGTPTEAPEPPGGEGPVDWVSGAFFVLSRDAYDQVGGLEESRFLYGEEMDWCWRARERGFLTVWSDAARVVHRGGASSEDRRGPLFVMNVESRVDMIRRRRGALQAILAREIVASASLVRWAWWRLRSVAQSRRGDLPARTREQLERHGAVVRWRWGKAR